MYKARLVLVTAAVVFAGAAIRADDAAEIRKILDKAIQAAGGMEKVAMLKNVTWKGKASFTEGDEFLNLHISARGWDRLRLELELGKGDLANGVVFTIVMNGKKAWFNHWNLREPAANEVALRDLYFAFRAAQMLPALLTKEFRLATLREVKVKDRPTVGIVIRRKDRPDVNLFFDKKTGLPVKAELRVAKPTFANQIFFRDYKDFNGVKHFSKVTFAITDKEKAINQTMIKTLELGDIRPQKQLAASLFDAPPANSPKSQPAFVTVRVPAADAQVWIDGRLTRQGGKERLFESPPLEPGEYTYEIRAKWRQDGKDMDQTRTVDVQPGQRVIVDFNRKK